MVENNDRMPLVLLAVFLLGVILAGLLDTYEVRHKYCSNLPWFYRKVDNRWQCRQP